MKNDLECEEVRRDRLRTKTYNKWSRQGAADGQIGSINQSYNKTTRSSLLLLRERNSLIEAELHASSERNRYKGKNTWAVSLRTAVFMRLCSLAPQCKGSVVFQPSWSISLCSLLALATWILHIQTLFIGYPLTVWFNSLASNGLYRC